LANATFTRIVPQGKAGAAMSTAFPRTTYHRSQGLRSWPIAWSRTTKWTVRGAPRYGVARALFDIFTKLKETL